MDPAQIFRIITNSTLLGKLLSDLFSQKKCDTMCLGFDKMEIMHLWNKLVLVKNIQSIESENVDIFG